MRGVYVGLGANIGDRAGNLFRARCAMAALPGTVLRTISRLYETEPVGVRDQPWFLNQVVELETDLGPSDLLARLLRIEMQLGRVRTVRWGPRPVDLDLLLYGSETLSTLSLSLPHPHLKERGFAVLPLLAINPELVLPDGKRLKAVAEKLVDQGPEVRRWEPLLLGQPLLRFAALDSTNAELQRLAAAGAEEGTTVVACTQSAGRGRQGRNWVSPDGLGLYLSTLFRPGFLASAEAPLLSIVGAVAACRAARKLGAGASLKWPNDLISAGRKAGGVLAEAASTGGELAAVVLGVGLNLNQEAEDFPPDLRQTATSLRLATGREINKEQAEKALLHELNAVYLDFLTTGAEELVAAYRGLLTTLGQTVRVSGRAVTLTGRATDVESTTGALILELADGRREVCAAGEVSLRSES